MKKALKKEVKKAAVKKEVKAAVKKAVKKEEVKKVAGLNRTKIILEKVEKGETRKAIILALIALNEKEGKETTPKSTAGLVSRVFTKYNLTGKVESGTGKNTAKKKNLKIKKEEPKNKKKVDTNEEF
jgi:hypothetical protein